ERELRRAEAGARGQREGVLADVLTSTSHAGPDRRGRVDGDVLRARVGVLDLHHGVRAGRHRGPGHDPVRGAGLERGNVRAARWNVRGDRQDYGLLARSRHVFGPYRVAVHRRVVERWQVDVRADV